MKSNLVGIDQLYELVRSDFGVFVERAFHELNPSTHFVPGKYIELLASRLDDVRTGRIKRLILNQPPRTLKSHVASVAFPAWLLGHHPDKQIICVSYSQDLADKHARDCRNLMESSFYKRIFPKTHLSSRKSSVNEFTTTAHGFRLSTSVGGTLTGRGGDLLILDDILKPENALSDTQRTAANEWYSNTLLSRLNNKTEGAIVIVMQRLHQQDLVGEVTDHETWDMLCLPAIAVEEESYSYKNLFGDGIFVRKSGTVLHPERDALEVYQSIRDSIGEYVFQSQYQQNPASREGGLIKQEWLRYYDPSSCSRNIGWSLQSWDTAFKGGTSNDFSVCTTWHVIDDKFYLIDLFRGRLSFPELKRAALAQYQKHNPLTVLIEDHGAGTSLIQELASEYVCGLEAYRAAPGSTKYSRIAAQSVKFESGRVYLPQQASWLNQYIKELIGFPGAKHDDQVDSTSQALEFLTSKAQPTGATKLAFNWLHHPRESC